MHKLRALTSTFAPERACPLADDPFYFALLIENIESGNEDAAHELHLHFFKGIRLLLARQLGAAPADELAERVFEVVIDSIHNRQVRTLDELKTFMLRTVHRTIAVHRHSRVVDVASCGSI